MTLFVAALIFAVSGDHAKPSIKATPDKPEILQFIIEENNLNSNTTLHQELALRDWKLLMPNWRPKTSAFAVTETKIESIVLE